VILSDVSIKRPVFAAVLSLLLVAFGLLAFDRLPLREFPNIDAPVVSIETTYRGASADVVESRITRVSHVLLKIASRVLKALILLNPAVKMASPVFQLNLKLSVTLMPQQMIFVTESQVY